MSFEQFNLHSNIYKAIHVCGYVNPTPIQAESIPAILVGKDLVASAQTGTGKTAAFVLPALHHLSNTPSAKKTRILILTPTRELASQITKAAATYGKFMRCNIVSLVGGMPYHHQIRDLARGADMIVATPGRLIDHMEQKRIDLSGIEMLILDEADRMLDMGFIEDVEYIAKCTPAKRQTLLFSATLDNKLMSVVKHLLKQPVRIDLSNKKITVPQIKQELYKAKNAQHKSRLLNHFLNDANIYKAIVFSATKINADKLADQLRDQGFAAAALHGDLKQKVRTRTLEQLRRGKIQILVATDVAARGIDVGDVTHVFNYDLPRFCEDYVHRIGRTGRAGKSGTAISFVLPTDMRHLQRIERYIGQRLKFTQELELNEQDLRSHLKTREVDATRHKGVDYDHDAIPFHSDRREKHAGTSTQREKRDDFRENYHRKKKPAANHKTFHANKKGNMKYRGDKAEKYVSVANEVIDRPANSANRKKDRPSSKKKFASYKKRSFRDSSFDHSSTHASANDRPVKKENNRPRKKFRSDKKKNGKLYKAV